MAELRVTPTTAHLTPDFPYVFQQGTGIKMASGPSCWTTMDARLWRKKHKFKCPKKQALHGDSFCRRPGRTIVVGAVVAVKVVVELYHCATGRTNIGT